MTKREKNYSLRSSAEARSHELRLHEPPLHEVCHSCGKLSETLWSAITIVSYNCPICSICKLFESHHGRLPDEHELPAFENNENKTSSLEQPFKSRRPTPKKRRKRPPPETYPREVTDYEDGINYGCSGGEYPFGKGQAMQSVCYGDKSPEYGFSKYDNQSTYKNSDNPVYSSGSFQAPYPEYEYQGWERNGGNKIDMNPIAKALTPVVPFLTSLLLKELGSKPLAVSKHHGLYLFRNSDVKRMLTRKQERKRERNKRRKKTNKTKKRTERKGPS